MTRRTKSRPASESPWARALQLGQGGPAVVGAGQRGEGLAQPHEDLAVARDRRNAPG